MWKTLLKIGIDKNDNIAYNRGINKRKGYMKESDKLRKENDKLQVQVEGQLNDINKQIKDILKNMRGE